jgi:hypothetical protein
MGNHRGFAPTKLIGLGIFKIFNAVNLLTIDVKLAALYVDLPSNRNW